MARPARAASSAPVTVTIPQNSTPDIEDHPEEKKSIWELMYAVPDQLWWDGSEGGKGYRVYLYDHEIARSPYLECIPHPFDVEWIKQKYGGGIYRVQLNDEGWRIVAREVVPIVGEAKRSKPVTNVQSAPVSSGPADPIAQVLGQFVEMLRENQRETREMLRDFTNRSYPAPQPAVTAVNPMDVMGPVLNGVVQMFTGMLPKANQQDPIDQMVKLKQLMGEPRDMLSELAKLKEAGLIGVTGGAKGDLLEQLEVVMTVAEKIGIGKGGGKSLTEIIAERAPDVLTAIKDGITEYRTLEEKRLQTAQVIASMQRGGNATQPAAGVQPAATQTAGLPAPAASVPPGSPVGGQLQVEPIGDMSPGAVQAEISEAQVNLVKQEIVECVKRGISGADIFGFLIVRAPMFIEGFCVHDSAGNVTGIVPEDQVVLFCSTDPILKAATQYPRFKTSMRELLEEVGHFKGLIDDDDEQEAPDETVTVTK